MNKKIALVLSGCGFKDGAEIHESVLALLAVVKNGATPLFFAPDKPQTTVTNHLSGDASGETRNVLVESARIARGEIKDLKDLSADKADAVIFPGGYGAALNLCDFAQKGPHCSVDPEVNRVIQEFFKAKKPMGFICIAPTFAAKALEGVSLTIGSDLGTATALKKMGAHHVAKTALEAHVDRKNKIVSTPAYMLAKNIAEVETGIDQLVRDVIKLISVDPAKTNGVQ